MRCQERWKQDGVHCRACRRLVDQQRPIRADKVQSDYETKIDAQAAKCQRRLPRPDGHVIRTVVIRGVAFDVMFDGT